MSTLLADLRHAFRVIRRPPAFALPAIGVLALGIGASTAIFSIVNAVLLRPLAFEQPERLVRLFTKTPDGSPFDLSAGKFYSWQQGAQIRRGARRHRPHLATQRSALQHRWRHAGHGVGRVVERDGVRHLGADRVDE